MDDTWKKKKLLLKKKKIQEHPRIELGTVSLEGKHDSTTSMLQVVTWYKQVTEEEFLSISYE